MSSPVALVTGGGSGIGLAVAEHLIQYHGFRVAIIDIDSQRVEEQASRLGSRDCLGIHADIVNYEQQGQAFLEAFEWGGNRLDLFFANAGMLTAWVGIALEAMWQCSRHLLKVEFIILGIGDTDSLYKTLEPLDEQTGLPKPLNLRTIDVDLNAVLQGIHLARHFFSEKGHKGLGRIVATSSVIGLYPNHALPLYTASKHAIVGAVRALAPVYLKDNITINAILPTLIYTNLMPKDVADEFHDPKQTTPMSTALKAFDAILGDNKLTGQIMELSLNDVVLKQQPEYSRENIKWMFEQWELWEKVCGPLMPREPGQNALRIQRPARQSI